MNSRSTIFTSVNSPFGTLVIAAARGKICSAQVITDDGRHAPLSLWRRADGELAEARAQLAAYFAGELRKFSLPLELTGTSFQKHAWRMLRAVPYGTTTTYGEIARAMGRPGAGRAVGGAMNRNPIAIVVPCHRVLGKNGSLTGYLNGIGMKRRLLAMESACQAHGPANTGIRLRERVCHVSDIRHRAKPSTLVGNPVGFSSSASA